MAAWSLNCELKSPMPKHLAAAMATECEMKIAEDSVEFTLNESRAKDLRAMWNTRMRSLMAAEAVLEVIARKDS